MTHQAYVTCDNCGAAFAFNEPKVYIRGENESGALLFHVCWACVKRVAPRLVPQPKEQAA